jgi:hypothetical protein
MNSFGTLRSSLAGPPPSLASSRARYGQAAVPFDLVGVQFSTKIIARIKSPLLDKLSTTFIAKTRHVIYGGPAWQQPTKIASANSLHCWTACFVSGVICKIQSSTWWCQGKQITSLQKGCVCVPATTLWHLCQDWQLKDAVVQAVLEGRVGGHYIQR